MKKFSFRLESLLKVCTHREEMEEIRLGELLRERQALEESLQRQILAQRRSQEDLSQRSQIVAQEVSFYRRYIHRLNLSMDELYRKRDLLEDKIGQQRAKLLEATQRRKVLEKLKERSYESYQKEVDRTLQALSDELFIQGKSRG